MKELGIYIHIPFCKKKCSYCDFVSFSKCEKKVEQYVNALKKEISNFSKQNEINNNGFEIDTIYIGGGTPSFIDSKYITAIINNVKNNFTIKTGAEITIEINPGTVNENKIKDYVSVGINRVSIGLQSTQERLLKEIGRIHNFEQFLETYNLLRKNGIKNINVDLMLGLPNQDINDLKESINKIVHLNPEHISIYSLILEEGTGMYKLYEENKLNLPSEEKEREMYWCTKKSLEEKGYIHYEISNFSKKGYKSKHNLNCWNQKEYIGFGLAAHSYLNEKRYCNISDLEKYINNIENGNYKSNIKICEIQNEEDKQKEFMLLGLRKIDGISIQEYKNKFSNNPIFTYRNILSKLVEEELIEIDLDNIKLTDKGLDLANIVWEEFI